MQASTDELLTMPPQDADDAESPDAEWEELLSWANVIAPAAGDRRSSYRDLVSDEEWDAAEEASASDAIDADIKPPPGLWADTVAEARARRLIEDDAWSATLARAKESRIEEEEWAATLARAKSASSEEDEWAARLAAAKSPRS